VASHVADFHDPHVVHPLFVAQDPNLFWSLVFNHGCIRAALEYVAPHVDWDKKVGRVKSPLEQVPIISEGRPGRILLKCGNEICLELERDGSKGTFESARGASDDTIAARSARRLTGLFTGGNAFRQPKAVNLTWIQQSLLWQ
jgi:hypothetical protein